MFRKFLFKNASLCGTRIVKSANKIIEVVESDSYSITVMTKIRLEPVEKIDKRMPHESTRKSLMDRAPKS